jgi:hypothetical protein
MSIIPHSTAPLPARRQLIAAIVTAFTAVPFARVRAQHRSSEREPSTSAKMAPASILVSPIAR